MLYNIYIVKKFTLNLLKVYSKIIKKINSYIQKFKSKILYKSMILRRR